MADLDILRETWKELYSKTLPSLARSRDPAQPKWPVTLDHCFARIILDNTVGEGVKQWDQVIKKPAVRTMTEQQLRDAIELGENIKDGSMDLRELDEISLNARGKNEGKYGKKRKHENDIGQKQEEKTPMKKMKTETQSKLSFEKKPGATDTKQQKQDQLPSPPPSDAAPGSKTPNSEPDLLATLKRIQSHPTLTPYRKRLYTILLSVPRGRHTTYAAMSDYLHSSARAVGNGMRNNPFAPDVPCHRVLAADGSLGGFGGDWGKEGKHATKKIELLRGEGVKFDGRGKVVGEVFRGFHEFEDEKG